MTADDCAPGHSRWRLIAWPTLLFALALSVRLYFATHQPLLTSDGAY